jgi:simple sugar transport system permease protein
VSWLWIVAIPFAAQVVRISVPYALASLGGALTERSGVIDLAIEAKLLAGAFAAAAVAHATGSTWLGLAGGMSAGVAVALVQAFCALWLEADQVIVGVALNLMMLGGTRFLLQVLYHEGANSPPCPEYGDAVLANPTVWLAVAAAVCVPLALTRTRWGLRLRAAGDRPDALVAVGASVKQERVAAVAVGGALAGAGGAQLALAVGGFVANISQGRGYMALVLVILSGWRPGWAALAGVGIAFADALNFRLQITGLPVLRELGPLLPYVLTLAVLVIFGGQKQKPPESLGKL